MRSLLFEDYFNDNLIDESKWNICEYNRMANSELQAYLRDNVKVVNNELIITSRCENRLDREFTSGKITTKGKFSFCNGIVEVVAKLPTAVGSWPAIWMMPEDTTGGWPRCGELDIIEHCGHKLNEAFFSIHTKDYNHVIGTQFTKTINIQNLVDGFHKYSIIWNENDISWYVDDVKYYEVHKHQLSKEDNWPFNKDFYLIINSAVGGNFCEGQLNRNDFPCEFIIKSVKVFSQDN